MQACPECDSALDKVTHSCRQRHNAPSLEQRVLWCVGLDVEEGHCRGASWQHGCLQTCTRQLLHCQLLLLLLQLFNVLLLLHGLLRLRQEQRHQLPGADMCNTCIKHKGSSPLLLLQTAVSLVFAVF